MALNTDPIFGKTQYTATVKVSTATGVANTDLDITPTNAVLVFTAPADGCAVSSITAMLVEPALTAAAALRVGVDKSGTPGSTVYTMKGAVHAAHTVSTTTVPTMVDFGFTEEAPLRLAGGDSLYVQARAASAVTDAFHVIAQYTGLAE